MSFLKSLRLDNFLSFPPGSEAVELKPLNVLIGPNGSGKSNFIEAIELLRATPTSGFSNAIRYGGTATEWLWKGEQSVESPNATIQAIIQGDDHSQIPNLNYLLSFSASGHGTEITQEILSGQLKSNSKTKKIEFYKFGEGNAKITILDEKNSYSKRRISRDRLSLNESILSQRKDTDRYPELAWLGEQFQKIQTFREWSFGRSSILRRQQAADLPIDLLDPNCSNLALLLNHLEHTDAGFELNRYLRRFLPRYEHLSTKTFGNAIQFYLHENGLKSPIPSTRLSDGTLRFVAILALLVSPTPPPLICLEEPELGLHPDAMPLLAELMVEVSSRTQLIVTTHSDAFVSALTEEADSVLVCEHLGGTVMRRIESEKLRYWLDRYRLGEIWRIGEIGGNP